jgi:beta-glucosidase
MPSTSRSSRVEALLDQMTLEEQVSLLAGSNMWNTVPNERLGIPKLRVSDGPAGVRGSRFDGPASMNIPCSTAIAASWDMSLVREVGELLGRELEAKGARVHLAPTVNLHRTPVGGRNFECMSEDPLLTAVTALEYVKGVQSNGVASCIKHLVGNDTEFERMTIDSQIDERTLREMYLFPFERAVIDGDVLSIMTSYNRINGPYAADSQWLLQDVVRDEWGFDGAFISDWYGLHSTAEGVNAGLDLEMPGPALFRGQKLIDAVNNGEVSTEVIRERARNVLNLMERTGGLDTPPGPETSRDDAQDLATLRRASSAGMVLLQNNDNTLPLVASRLKSVAVLGPNAATATVMGGGSAHVTPTRFSHPLDALMNRLQPLGIDVQHSAGCNINKKLPELDVRNLRDVRMDYFNDVAQMDNPSAVPDMAGTTGVFRLLWTGDPLGRREPNISFGARMSAVFTPHVSGEWSFSLESVAASRIIIDGAIVLDNADVPSGGSFFGMGKPETIIKISLEAEREYSFVVEVRHTPIGSALSGLTIGAMGPIDYDQLGEAIDLAARSDVSIVVVGTNDDWESEGWDRDNIDLPGKQDILIHEVAKVSKRTIVVINAGSPVAMPWLNEVDAVVYTWFAGQEMGDALVDLLMGDFEPSGRLPVTMPRRMEDTPAAEHHPGRNGAAKYIEGRLIGYRWYDTVGREPQFPFGFGLGYAKVEISDAATSGAYMVNTSLTNASDRDGVQVVQVYAHLVNREGLASDEPFQRLVGWTRVVVPAGGSVNAVVKLDRDAYRTWDVEAGAWAQWTGDVELRVGTSSRNMTHFLPISV